MRLLFVYNADAGLFNALSDSAHKLISPDTYACSLCGVTYGLVAMKQPWRRFIEALPYPVTFLHRDEFRESYEYVDVELPALLAETEDEIEILLEREEMDAAASLEAMIALVESVLPKAQVDSK